MADSGDSVGKAEEANCFFCIWLKMLLKCNLGVRL